MNRQKKVIFTQKVIKPVKQKVEHNDTFRLMTKQRKLILKNSKKNLLQKILQIE